MRRVVGGGSTARRAVWVAVLLGVLAAGFGVWAAVGFGASAPPVPVIVPASKPANPTASQSAALQYTDSVSVSFQCSLDGSSFTACGSGTSGSKSYSGLAAGSHTFQVRAAQGLNTSSAASYTWVIDRTAPTASIMFPANNGVYNAASYNAGCSPTGICGSAADPSGVASVRVSVRRSSTNKYWNGSSFGASSETFLLAAGTTSWKYGLVLPPDDTYVVHVQATDSLGNAQTGTTYAATASFTIDTTPPPAPTITSGPVQYPPFGWPSTSATFQFSDGESGVSFLCNRDGIGYVACASPTSYAGLAQGTHTFRVEAKDAAGNISGPSAVWTWFVDTVAPNKPTLTSFPTDPSSSTSATFAWTDTDPAPGSGIAAYFCKLDASSYQSCTSPKGYTGLSVASHTFSVFAVDWAGNISQAQTYTWAVATATGMPFTISGNASGLLYPGAAPTSIPLALHNPNSVTIYVTGITVTVSASPAGCPAGSNVAIVQSNASSGNMVTIPAGATVTLPAGTVSAPTIQLVNLPSSQQGCKNVSFSLAYGGSSHS